MNEKFQSDISISVTCRKCKQGQILGTVHIFAFTLGEYINVPVRPPYACSFCNEPHFAEEKEK